LGRPKLISGTGTRIKPPTGPLFPIRLKEDEEHSSGFCPEIGNRLLEAQLVVSGRARVIKLDQISLLRNRGYYGYLPSEERLFVHQFDMDKMAADTDDEEIGNQTEPFMMTMTEDRRESVTSDGKSELFLTGEEILFLSHTLGCLDILLPPDPNASTPTDVTYPLRLWFYLCSGNLSARALEPHVARTENEQFRSAEQDLLRRYAAYLYYRARGWIVRPGLALGGVHFLLYAQSPSHRHAAFAVLVDPATAPDTKGEQVTCAEMAAHVRVVHSVGKSAIM
uniref:tRNA-intron lyase n=1 Tax=Echinostoma caproni TaxID=27848 RepID=A0A183AAH4_9TREM